MPPQISDTHPVVLHTSQIRRALVDPADIKAVIGFQNDINAILARIELSPRAWEPLAKPFSYARRPIVDFDRDDEQDEVITAVKRLSVSVHARNAVSRDRGHLPAHEFR
jgi:hypothetical protein